MKRTFALVSMLMLVFSAVLVGNASPEISWPERTLEIICPYSAGGGSDIMARSLAKALEDTGKLGQTIIVTNKTGGNGLIGASYVANKPNDQYTFVTNVTGDLGAWITSGADMKMDYFKPVAMFCWDVYVLVVSSDSPFNSMAELIDFSKDHVGEVTVAGVGFGTVDHILYKQMVENYGFQAEYVSFEGGGEVVTSILGKHVTANWCNPSEAQAYLESGDMKALAVAGDIRLNKLPDIASTSELGFEKVMWRQYRGLLATKNTPDEVIEKLVGVMEEACESDFFQKEYLEKRLLTFDFKSGEEFQKVINESWAELLEVLAK